MFFLQHVTHAQNLYQQSAVPAAELKLVGCVEEAVPRSASDVCKINMQSMATGGFADHHVAKFKMFSTYIPKFSLKTFHLFVDEVSIIPNDSILNS